jgi:serine/threonine-protein kinase
LAEGISVLKESTISHYTILEKLGEGGMGEVYLAEDTRLERKVALKFLPPHIAREPDALERFKREAKATAALRHPNIVTIHEIGVHEDRHYIVMAYIDGDLLKDMIDRKNISVDEALDITLELCDALGDAHGAGIIHRDLKPANIIVDAKGHPHVLDFGLALKIGSTKLTQDGTTVGSLHYMSPEQSRGESVDARTDIFSLGAILYEMIAGQPAFPGEHAAAIQYKITHEDPQPLARFNNQVTPELERIVSTALSRDREVRYQTMGGLAAALKPLRAGSTGESGPKLTVVQRLRSAAATVGAFLLRPAVISGVLLGVIGFTAGAWLTNRADQRTKGTDRVSQPLARYSVPVSAELPIVPRPDCSAVAIKPDGQYLVYVTSMRPDENVIFGDTPSLRTFLCGRAIDGFEIEPIDGTEGGAAPFFSPDGKWIGFVDYDHAKLKKVAVGGGAPVELCDVTYYFRQASWGDDGRIYFGSDLGIYVVPDVGGTPTPVTMPDPGAKEKTRRFPHVLPGSRALLFTLGPADILSYDDAEVALFILETGEMRVLVPGGTNPFYAPTGHIVFGRGGKLYAVRFDPETYEVLGSPFAVLDGLITSDGYGSVHCAFSRNGTLVYVPGGPEHYYSELSTIDLDGKVEHLPIPPNLYGGANVSPDGDRLLLSILGANASLWMFEFQRGTMTRMTREWDNYSTAWRPSGRSITFASNRGGSAGIWQTADDGAGQPQKLVGTSVSAAVGSWSGDGKWLSYSPISAENSADIWVISGDDNRVSEPIIESPFQEFNSSFSPDGRWIAYVSDESGQPEIYVQPFPITGQKWRLSQNGGDAPKWSADGRTVYFLRGNKIMSVSIDTESKFVPGRAEILLKIEHLDVQYFDVFPDGKRFIVIGPKRVTGRRGATITPGALHRLFPATTPEIRVVVNWFEEFR